METSRLEKLEEFARQNPADAFSQYGLALEYSKLGRHDEALALFNRILGFNADYVAAYHQAGLLLMRLGRTEEARAMFRRGIEAAGRVGNLHAKSEMEATLAELG